MLTLIVSLFILRVLKEQEPDQPVKIDGCLFLVSMLCDVLIVLIVAVAAYFILR